MNEAEKEALAAADAVEKAFGPDPVTLAGQARPDHQRNNLMLGADVIDDSFGRGTAPDGKYFVARRYDDYMRSRTRLNPAFDYAGATADVQAVLAQRKALAAAMAAWRRAPAAIVPADQRDLDEAAAARRDGRDIPAPHHGRQARADADTADMGAAFALNDAKEGERALATSFQRHAFDIYEVRQAAITARRGRYLDLIAQARREAAAIRAEEDDLGAFGVEVLMKLVDPNAELAAELPEFGADDPPRNPHPVTVGEVLAGTRTQPHGRQLPRGPEAELKKAALWGRSTPWASAWRYTPAGPVARTSEPEPQPRNRGRARKTAPAT